MKWLERDLRHPYLLRMFNRYFMVAVLALGFAAAGIWFYGARTEYGVVRALAGLHRAGQIPELRGSDSVYWLSYAQDLLDSGHLTSHFTRMDNAPWGRENIGWAALTMWHVALFGKVWAMATGLPIKEALLLSARWANPVLYFALLSGILLTGWRIGRFPSAAVATLILATSRRVYDDFGFATPDHHGWHDITTLGTILFLAGAVRNPGRKRWFVLAGITAAMAMWIGATEQTVTVGGACAGAFAGILITGIGHRFSKPHPVAAGNDGVSDEPMLPPPGHWRLFGITACVLSLLFYLFEFPHHLFRMRLEVNHPVFSLAFLAGGEFLCRSQRLLFSKSGKRARSDVPVLLLSGLVLGAIAAACAVGPVNWHVMHQPFIQRYHLEVAECKPLLALGASSAAFLIVVPALLVLCGGMLVLFGRLDPNDRIALSIAAVPCAASVAAAFLQFRWAGLAGAAASAIAAILYLPRGRRPHPPAKQSAAPASNIIGGRLPSLLGVAIPIVVAAIMLSREMGDDSAAVESETLDCVASADLGKLLKQDAESMHRPPVVVFAGQDDRQAWLGYVYDIPGVGSLYWDNYSGLRDQLEFLAGYKESEAHRIAKERGITHVVVPAEGSGAVVAYHFILHGTREPPEIRQTMAYRLAAPVPNPPDWMQPVAIHSTAIRSEGLRVYRVTP